MRLLYFILFYSYFLTPDFGRSSAIQVELIMLFIFCIFLVRLVGKDLYVRGHRKFGGELKRNGCVVSSEFSTD